MSEGALISGAMMAVNPNVPGSVRMAIIRVVPIKGSGLIATVTFDRIGSSPGKIISLVARLATINGASLPALVQVNNPPDSSSIASNPPQDQDAPASTTTAKRTNADIPGTPSTNTSAVILAGPTAKADEGKDALDIEGTKERNSLPVPPEDSGEPMRGTAGATQMTDNISGDKEAASTGKPLKRKVYAQKSILDRFREHKGDRTAKALIALFETEGVPGFSQDPPIALSDGKTLVKVRFTSTSENETVSDVAVMGARLLSIKRDTDRKDIRVVELAPNKGEYDASIAVSQNSTMTVYPLTIAPKIDIGLGGSKAVSEDDFRLFLKGSGGSKKSPFDLNGDSEQNYIDDYIFTANYIVARENSRTTHDHSRIK